MILITGLVFLSFYAFASSSNLIKNGNFTENLINLTTVPANGNFNTNGRWTLLLASDGGAVARVENRTVKIEIQKAGAESWAEQLIQAPITLEHNSIYKVSFEARASFPRNIEVKLGGTADVGWVAYDPGTGDAGGKVFGLTTEMKEYEFTFTMMHPTDNKARFEFELGLATGTVWIKNVNLEKIGVVELQSSTPTTLSTSVLTNVKSWKLVWDDEFNGSKIDTSKWSFEIGNGTNGWGNNELEYYTPDNAYLKDGNLVIEAKKQKIVVNGKTYDYTSARMTTENKFSFEYGKIAFRAELPEGQGIWPAVWMLGDNFKTVGWPACGEIDLMELIGNKPGTVYGTIHGPISGGPGIGASYTLPDGKTFADAFHTFTVIWNKEAIGFYVDGHLYNFITKSWVDYHYGNSEWVYNHKFFLILDVAVGGNWPGNPNSTTQFPQKMKIDYIRVYKGE